MSKVTYFRMLQLRLKVIEGGNKRRAVRGRRRVEAALNPQSRTPLELA
jgi:hypothetical protein